MNFFRTQIASLNKKSSKNIASYSSDKMSRLPCHFKYTQCCNAALDSIELKNIQTRPP